MRLNNKLLDTTKTHARVDKCTSENVQLTLVQKCANTFFTLLKLKVQFWH